MQAKLTSSNLIEQTCPSGKKANIIIINIISWLLPYYKRWLDYGVIYFTTSLPKAFPLLSSAVPNKFILYVLPEVNEFDSTVLEVPLSVSTTRCSVLLFHLNYLYRNGYSLKESP